MPVYFGKGSKEAWLGSDIIYQYCKEMSGLEVLIPLSIDTPKGFKIDSYDINKLKAKYLS